MTSPSRPAMAKLGPAAKAPAGHALETRPTVEPPAASSRPAERVPTAVRTVASDPRVVPNDGRPARIARPADAPPSDTETAAPRPLSTGQEVVARSPSTTARTPPPGASVAALPETAPAPSLSAPVPTLAERLVEASPATVPEAAEPASRRLALPSGIEAMRLSAGPEGRLTLELRPTDLGRVEIAFEFEGERLRALVACERPATADLMRRHADVLQSHLREAGFEGASLCFMQERPARPTPATEQYALAPMETPSPAHVHQDTPPDISAGIDLRL